VPSNNTKADVADATRQQVVREFERLTGHPPDPAWRKRALFAAHFLESIDTVAREPRRRLPRTRKPAEALLAKLAPVLERLVPHPEVLTVLAEALDIELVSPHLLDRIIATVDEPRDPVLGMLPDRDELGLARAGSSPPMWRGLDSFVVQTCQVLPGEDPNWLPGPYGLLGGRRLTVPAKLEELKDPDLVRAAIAEHLAEELKQPVLVQRVLTDRELTIIRMTLDTAPVRQDRDGNPRTAANAIARIMRRLREARRHFGMVLTDDERAKAKAASKAGRQVRLPEFRWVEELQHLAGRPRSGIARNGAVVIA